MTEYIKADLPTKGALYDIQQERATVFLYGNEAGELVGFASYGTNLWPVAGHKRKVHHLVACGIDKRLRRKPDGPREERYAAQIVDDIVAHARAIDPDKVFPALTLFVHPDNIGAKRLYEGAGIKLFPHTYPDKASGIVYEGMAVSLTDTPVLAPE